MKRKGTNVRMLENFREELFSIAQSMGRTLSEVVREAVEEWIMGRKRIKK
ncbi:hypothetical protein [Thermodesulfovibrio yellowstonii]|uniref:Ribbon-helix-helix protein CopG domain-containing protein n=1 Tax=Thermodesulfovibrio yellowstonii TaxID=28262 RepID=A0A9W6GFS3_9BACT|nr:hypothetical protein [Thermodesulfovibrio islandicus]GLI53350.1 hypothetical protein TISLANDTSLP1_10430 [Thermodesulfovibrio islandicus]